ncbi:MAG: energy-coupling factor transporter transmembrane component T [Eubacteriales bacterium]
MLKDITLGQYYPTNSVIHRLDPRVKLIATFIFLISLFLNKTMLDYGLPLLFLGSMIFICKVPFSFMLKGMRAILFLLILTVGFNLFLTPGEPLYSIWILTITKEGLVFAVRMVIRLVFLIIGSSIMTLTTTPNQLTDGLEKIMKPLNYIKVPVHEISMMMAIALRFIPILLEETDKIMKAQIARGADFEHKNLIKRVKSYIPILVPLFISAFRRANDLALAMEARCYRGGEFRTKMKPLHYHIRDYVAYGILLFYSAGIIIIYVLQSV